MTTAGFQSPNHTQTPNDLFDLHLADMNKAELKVVLAVIRQTLGFHRRKTRISIRDIKSLTGLAHDSIYAGAEAAEERGVLKRHQDGKVTEWEIIWNDPPDVGVESVPENGTLESEPFQESEQTVPENGTDTFQLQEQSDPADGTPSVKESSKKGKVKENSERKDLAPTHETSAEDRHRDGVRGALERGQARHAGQNGQPDYSKFLAGAEPVIRKLHELWRLPVPKRTGVCRAWSEEAFRVIDACDGLDVEEVLDLVFKDWLQEKRDHEARGKPVFWIERPNFLIGKVRAKVGHIRQEKDKYADDDFWD